MIARPVLRQSTEMDVDNMEDEAEDEEEEEEATLDNGEERGSGDHSASQSSYAPSPALRATISPNLYPTLHSALTLTPIASAGAAGSDAEAGHALMMLGSAERRADGERRGMRVEDLISS
jgi:hypothetical protein